MKSYLPHHSGLEDLMLFAVQSNHNVFCLLLELKVFEVLGMWQKYVCLESQMCFKQYVFILQSASARNLPN